MVDRFQLDSEFEIHKYLSVIHIVFSVKPISKSNINFTYFEGVS